MVAVLVVLQPRWTIVILFGEIKMCGLQTLGSIMPSDFLFRFEQPHYTLTLLKMGLRLILPCISQESFDDEKSRVALIPCFSI